MQKIITSNKTTNRLHASDAIHGLDGDTHAEELLAISPAISQEQISPTFQKTHSVMEFCGISPSGRTAAEIDAEIEAGRAEWDS